ncbi:TetR/AcrR family transcriptional regulator [Pseudovibrio sp. Ad37]|uniref:TetR/AcrR family transcriptional regulator n=1 Tax=Pseudovibrio sp. Ad37 TaxID=989422 RepID=UPI0007AE832D|nr:TetR/AcrR family transcriptional regulator [Pseudovibrio sp. Ad37]KZL27939.1 Nucleoid occlusion factor SlmA [Pseudovibrio sp. Ad37]
MPSMNAQSLALRKKAKQQRSREKIELILQTTLDMLSEGQVDKINTNEIARRAGVSVGSLYNFFPNKQSILYELFRRWLENALTGLDDLDVRYNGSEPIRDYIDDMFEQIAINAQANTAGHWQLRRSMNSSKELSELEEAHMDQILARFIRIQKKFGRQLPDNPHRLAYLQNLVSVSCLNIVALTADEQERKTVMHWCKKLLYLVFDVERLEG